MIACSNPSTTACNSASDRSALTVPALVRPDRLHNNIKLLLCNLQHGRPIPAPHLCLPKKVRRILANGFADPRGYETGMASWTTKLADCIEESATERNQVAASVLALSIHLHPCRGAAPPSPLSSRQGVPGFPTSRHPTTAACAVPARRDRMKSTEATNLDWKSGERSGGICSFPFARSETPLWANHLQVLSRRACPELV